MAKTKTTEESIPGQQVPEGDVDKQQVQSVEFGEVSEDAVVKPGGQFDILLDMHVPVTVALGQTEIPVRRLLQLGPGAVLELNKSVDAPVDLYLQGTKFAEGDVVVVDERFGIRIREILGIDANTPPE